MKKGFSKRHHKSLHQIANTKLSPKDEFLITLMKLRLSFHVTDLSQCFRISNGLYTHSFLSMVGFLVEYFESFVYMLDMKTILATTPKRYRNLKNLLAKEDR